MHFLCDGRIFLEQAEIFEEVAALAGEPPPVVDAADILAAPEAMLARLCAALGLPFDRRMLSWPPGRRATDGVWAAHWYGAVERSTGFAPPFAPVARGDLSADGRRIADAAAPIYRHHAQHRLRL
jgi:hypothetical protein